MKKLDFERLAQEARQASLLEYFQRSGYTVKRQGSEYYVTDIPGLCIKPDTNQWFHHYTGQGSTNNSVNCLVWVLGKDFRQAVYELTGQDITHARSDEFPRSQRPQYTAPPRPAKPEPVKKELEMPAQAENMRRMFAYLCQSRKIPAAIVEELVHANLLYQSENTVDSIVNGEKKTYHNANAVFVHRDADGKAIGAELQGCNTFRRFKGIAPGTGDSAFMFTPVPARDGKVRRAYIFESAIDLLSFYTFCVEKDRRNLVGSLLVSMAGLKPSVPKRLQEQGIEIISCVDNDDAGRRFEKDNGFVRSASVKAKLDEQGVKDWNELLVQRSQGEQPGITKSQPTQAQQPQAAFRGRRA